MKRQTAKKGREEFKQMMQNCKVNVIAVLSKQLISDPATSHTDHSLSAFVNLLNTLNTTLSGASHPSLTDHEILDYIEDLLLRWGDMDVLVVRTLPAYLHF